MSPRKVVIKLLWTVKTFLSHSFFFVNKILSALCFPFNAFELLYKLMLSVNLGLIFCPHVPLLFLSFTEIQLQHNSPSSTGSAHTDSSSCSSVKTAPTHSYSHKAIQVTETDPNHCLTPWLFFFSLFFFFIIISVMLKHVPGLSVL